MSDPIYDPAYNVRIVELEAERDALIAAAGEAVRSFEDMRDTLRAERDALRGAVEAVREWAELVKAWPSDWDRTDIGRGKQHAAEQVLAILDAAETQRGPGSGGERGDG